ncbi:MAG: MazG nucleotide pyrophosphohydrolase domain-containing protein [Dehalococcoidia bacterium]|tara:strand:+ start:1189 stop:1833 length:645 start_codon:yes stop_codon:yes gene_type:complete
MNSTNKLEEAIIELYKTVKKLRSENGCPWDKNQTSESLSQYILQEAYEVLESIDSNGKNLSEELGDLLFQIIIQSVIAEESNSFTFIKVVKQINEKLIERHPHVFLENNNEINEEQVINNWGKMKKNKLKNEKDYIKNITKTLPSLSFAYDLIRKSNDLSIDIFQDKDFKETTNRELLNKLFEITLIASKNNLDLENEFRKYLNKKQLDIIKEL